jgi:hypothetical protein
LKPGLKERVPGAMFVNIGQAGADAVVVTRGEERS